jgi:hypothetical protein
VEAPRAGAGLIAANQCTVVGAERTVVVWTGCIGRCIWSRLLPQAHAFTRSTTAEGIAFCCVCTQKRHTFFFGPLQCTPYCFLYYSLSSTFGVLTNRYFVANAYSKSRSCRLASAALSSSPFCRLASKTSRHEHTR